MGQAVNRWEEWERQVIIKYLEKYPHNFTLAFERAAEELDGRTILAISNQYYTKIKPVLKEQNLIVTAQGSKHGLIANTKNTPRRNQGEQVTMVTKMIDLLSKDKQQEIAMYIFKKMKTN